MKVLVTGAAGFIGYHTAKALAQSGADDVVGLDSINDYYDVALKYARLGDLGIKEGALISAKYPNLSFIKADLADFETLNHLFERHHFECVINLAAQAGVRYSLKSPQTYIDSNITGFLNILECCRRHTVDHLIYASSSSVYGLNSEMPFSEEQRLDFPASLYACTKKSNELMAHAYSHLFGIPATGVRFFTVYGPWGRPDMACFKFAEQICAGEPIEIYNFGKMRRDFTYIDDVVKAITALIAVPPDPIDEKITTSTARSRVFNIGNNAPVDLLEFVRILEELLGKSAQKILLPMQPGDVPETYASIDKLKAKGIFAPDTPLKEGLKRFVEWYKTVYQEIKLSR
ncbi:MAG: NAD-dependent epimerase/dehydratase family protein [Helicobacteraceae bacterium]|jgi:UDP-glucuronate 4-epimerase|nr:NAD-dependent epimerase/dehydratase family protein [Helicobacteraceae bacterium]